MTRIKVYRIKYLPTVSINNHLTRTHRISTKFVEQFQRSECLRRGTNVRALSATLQHVRKYGLRVRKQIRLQYAQNVER